MWFERLKKFYLDNKIKVNLITIVIALTILILMPWQINRSSVINQTEHYLQTEFGLKDVKAKISSKEDGEYRIIATCSNLDSLQYEEMIGIPYYYNVNGAMIQNIICKGDTYRIETTYVVKNGETVFEKIFTHSCERCTDDGPYTYRNPFSGNKEYYCERHYNELQDMINSLN